jgi:hypothetical protein
MDKKMINDFQDSIYIYSPSTVDDETEILPTDGDVYKVVGV